jgi:maleamate amidohydrolase
MAPDEIEIFKRQQFGHKLGLGRSPALLVVDFVNGFVDPHLFGGGNIAAAAASTLPVLQAFRAAKCPVVFSRIIYAEDGSDATVHCLKVPRLKSLTRSNPASQIIDELAPLPGEIVVDKRLPSVFFETGLHGLLSGRGVDTIVVTGCTTSGCVRATVLDGLCHGFRPIVPADCVGDRAQSPHEASLFDLSQKYADVVHSQDVTAFLSQLKSAAA